MSYKFEQPQAAKAKAEAEAKAVVDLEIAQASAEDIAAAKALADADEKIAADAQAEADAEAADLLATPPAADADEAYYRVITGYPVYHPYQSVLVKNDGATKLKMDGWVQAQLDAGILIKASAPE